MVVAKQLWGEDRVALEDPAGSLRDTLSSATGARPKPGLEGGGGFKSLTAHHKIKYLQYKGTRPEETLVVKVVVIVVLRPDQVSSGAGSID